MYIPGPGTRSCAELGVHPRAWHTLMLSALGHILRPHWCLRRTVQSYVVFTYQVIKIFAFPLIGLDYLGAHLDKCLCFIHNKVDVQEFHRLGACSPVFLCRPITALLKGNFHRIPQQGGLYAQGAVKMAQCKELATKRETGVQSQDPRGRGGESVPKSCSLICACPGRARCRHMCKHTNTHMQSK